MPKFLFILLAAFLTTSSSGFAAYPLVTDDAGTVGKGRTQIEVSREDGFDKDSDDKGMIKKMETGVPAVVTYGISESFDIITGVPYLRSKVAEDGNTAQDVNGMPDVSIEAKWRFYENKGLNLALKPGITVPTGDHRKGLGSGRPAYGLTFVATKGLDPFALHFNAGYIRNENKLGERRDMWRTSLAGEFAADNKVRIVANVGLENNPDPESNAAPAFALGGLIYSVTESVDLDAGYKMTFNGSERDGLLLMGITFRF